MEQTTSVDKAIDVLFHLHAEKAPCGVTAIGNALGIPKSSAHRLLTALGRRGLVERDERGRYRPGVALVALGVGVLDREPVVAAARPVLEAEVEALDETLFLTAARGGRIVVLDKVEGTGFLRASPRIGSDVPVHATAVGRLYLAFAPTDVVLPKGGLVRFTPATTTSRAVLEGEVAQVRRDGWAENREQWLPGVVVVAAPVFVGEDMVAALAMAAAAAQVPPRRAAAVGARLSAAGRRIAARLDGGGARQSQGETP